MCKWRGYQAVCKWQDCQASHRWRDWWQCANKLASCLWLFSHSKLTPTFCWIQFTSCWISAAVVDSHHAIISPVTRGFAGQRTSCNIFHPVWEKKTLWISALWRRKGDNVTHAQIVILPKTLCTTRRQQSVNVKYLPESLFRLYPIFNWVYLFYWCHPFPYCGLSFCPFDSVLWLTEAFLFHEVSFVNCPS